MRRFSRSAPARISRAIKRSLVALVDSDRRRALGREVFFRLAAHFTPVIAVRSEGLRYLVSTEDRGVGMTLFMGNDVERRTLGRVIELVASHQGQFLGEGKALIDIGANIGTTTLTGLHSFGFERAVCIEPLPANQELLEHNLRANGFQDRAVVIGLAVSDQAGTARFEVAPGNPSDARIRRPGLDGSSSQTDVFGEARWETVDVRTATFDSLIEDGSIDLDRVGLVWVDAQGHEGQILGEAQGLVASSIPVVIEFWPYGLRRSGGLERLCEIIEKSFSGFIDLGDESHQPRVCQPAEIGALERRYPGTAHTDILLLS